MKRKDKKEIKENRYVTRENWSVVCDDEILFKGKFKFCSSYIFRKNLFITEILCKERKIIIEGEE